MDASLDSVRHLAGKGMFSYPCCHLVKLGPSLIPVAIDQMQHLNKILAKPVRPLKSPARPLSQRELHMTCRQQAPGAILSLQTRYDAAQNVISSLIT